MTIAIPISQDRISPLLDAATRLLLVIRRRGKEVTRRECVLEPLPPDQLAQKIAELGPDVLICAGLSATLQYALEKSGIHIRSHRCGSVEEVLRAHACRRLNQDQFRMPGCRGRHWKGQCMGLQCIGSGPSPGDPKRGDAGTFA